MSWYWWVLLWAVVVIGSAAVLGVLVRSLWRKITLLGAELRTAQERLGEVTDQLHELGERDLEPAVFTSASQLRQDRYLRSRRGYDPQSVRSTEPLPGTARSSGQRVR